jgi:filamentous hemagglutinin family protein
MRNPALSRVVRGLSSRTSTSAIIAGLVLVAPITHAISAGFSGTVANSTPGISASSASITFNSSIAGTDHGVINWTPTDDAVNAGAPIDFLPSGQTAVFQTDGGSAPYTILNRVVPTDISRPIALNGLINAYAGTAQSGNIGGNIWFYSPAGILVGGSAVFNIGSLLLTSSDPVGSGDNSFITTDETGTHFSLGQANNGSKVTIASGAQINAMSQPGSYIALVAPSITQSGMVTVNGSAAYVAARSVDMTINNGLFDISVTMPTEEVGPQLIHDGSTTGPASVQGEPHRIYLVSVPKNDAITLLISGGSTLGFDVAGAADVQGNAIVLSAGHNISGGSIDSSSATAANASIAINTGEFTSAVTGAATHNAIVSNGGNAVSIHFASDLTLTAPNLVSVGSATAGQSVSIDRNLLLDASVDGTTDGGPVTAGTAQLFATGGGAITVGGTVDLLATATGSGSAINMGVPVGANGGFAQILSLGGAIDITGATALDAGATSGSSDVAPATALALIAGHTNVQADGPGASVYLHGGLTAFASALGDFDVGGSTVNGTSAQGGSVLLENSGGGTLTVDGLASLNADGSGQTVGSGPVGGTGAGGQIDVNAADGAMMLTGGLYASAVGSGGDAYNTTSSGGLGTGGQITIGAANAAGSLTIGQVDSESSLNVSARAQGGSFGVAGGNGVGGQVHLVANGGTTHVFVPTSLDAAGSGGSGVMSGNGIGGLAEINSVGGTITLEGQAQLSADASSGMAGNSETGTPQTGNAMGGTAQIVASGAGQITINDDVTAHAGAYVPIGDVSANAGGNGTGGTFNLFGNGTGNIHVTGNVNVYVNANGGDNQFMTGTPGTGQGGDVFVDARDTTTLTIDGALFGSAEGTGGNSNGSGTGGAGTGGLLVAGGGSGQLVLHSVSFSADGGGGDGLLTGAAGTGGTASVRTFTAGGIVKVSEGVTLTARGFGGDADVYGTAGTSTLGGAGLGGTAAVDAEGGSIAIGGMTSVDPFISLNTSGFGGDGFNGGAGTGGGVINQGVTGATILARAGGVMFSPGSDGRNLPVQLTSEGTGGNGKSLSDGTAGAGGTGQGGIAEIRAENNAMNLSSDIGLTQVQISAAGTGGDGGNADSLHIGGAGGAGQGGRVSVNAQAGNGHVTTTELALNAQGYGGFGGNGSTGGVGGIGGGGGATAGVLSGAAQPASTSGTASLGIYTADTGGFGGEGGFGYTQGGAGGFGKGGKASIESSGGVVAASSVTMYSDGAGGDGGSNQSENIQADGVGGDGGGGSFAVFSEPRFQTGTTGSLTVSGDIFGSASGIGGDGRQVGTAFAGDFLIKASGGSITAQNIDIGVTGDIVPTDPFAVTSEISAVGNGVINVNQFSATSSGDIGLFLDGGGSVNASSASIFARSVTPFGEQDTAAPTGTGTFNAGSLLFVVQQDFRTNASFTTAADFQLDASGIVQTSAITSLERIRLSSGGAMTLGALVAGNKIEIQAGGDMTVASASAGRVNPSTDSQANYEVGIHSGTNINIGAITAKGNVGMAAQTGSVTAGNVTTDQSLVVLSANNITLGSVATATTGSGTGVYLADASMYSLVAQNLDPPVLFAVTPVAAGGSIQINGPVSTSQFVAAAHGAFASSSIDATDRINIDFDSTTGATHGTGLTTGNLTSGRGVLLQTDGNASIGSVTASDSIVVGSAGTTSIGNLSAGRVNPTVNTVQGYVANVFAGGGSTIGSVTAKGEVRFGSGNGSVSAGNIVTDRDLIVLAKQNVTLGSITTALLPTVGGPSNNQTTNPGAVYIGRSNGTIMPAWQTLSIDPVRVDGSITINGAVTTGQFQAAASGTFTASSIASNDFIFVDAGGAIAINALASRYKTKITGDGAATIGSMDTGDEGHVEVAGQVTVTSATAGRMTFSGTAPSGGNQNINGNDDGPSVVLVGGTGVSLGTASALGDIGLVSNGNVVVTGNLVSDASVGALVGGNVTLGAVTTGGGANGLYIGNSSLYPLVKDSNGNAAEILFSYSPPPPIGGSILINGPVSGGRFEAAALGNITTGALTFVNDVQAVAGGSMTTGAITSQQRIDLTSGGSSALGALVAGNRIEVEAGGSAVIASASAGRVNPSTDSTADYLVGIRSGTGVSIGDVTAKGNVGLLATTGNVSAGNVTADQSLVVLSANNVTLGNVTTSGDGVYLANASMYPIVADVLTPSLLFAQAPARVGGSILINGAVSTKQFTAASTGAFTANALAASSGISIDSGGFATFNGAVTAATISIGSLDLAIGSTGSLGGTGTSSLTLTSGGTDTTIGGSATTGLTVAATTYQLDNAEFGRLRAGQINVAAQGNVTLGTLNISGSGSATGNLVGSNARFQVQTPGSIRVVGSVNLANAASTDTLGFIAGNRFEIVTDTGQLQLLGTDGKVGGIAAITAANIAVGTSSIVTQLAINPKFAGRDSLLVSAPLMGSKLDGYLQAGRMKFTVGNTLLIQNSGTGSTLAGFTVGSGGIQIANSSTSPIDVVIYGRAFDSSGTEIATASIGSAVTASQTSAISNVDGCVFATGVCSPVNSGASAQMVAQTQLASISSSIQSAVVGGNVGAGAPPPIDNGTSSVGSSVGDGGGAGAGGGGDDDEGGGEKTEAKGNGGGAAKPNVLIDTNAIASGTAPQIDTPVTSSGNTSLWIGEDGLTGDIGSSGTGNSQ